MKRKVFIACLVALGLILAGCSRLHEETPREEVLQAEEILRTEESIVAEEPERREETVEETNERSEESVVSEKEKKEEEREEETSARYVLSLVDGLNVRTGAGKTYSSLGQLDKGDMVSLVGKSGNWYETRYCGRKAYVSADEKYTHIYEIGRADERTERVIEVGCEKLGTPYVYGATRVHNGDGIRNNNFDENKFDCSSFVQYMFYYGAGINVQVNTRTQVFQGEEVKWEEIQRGDLLFFTNASRQYNKGIERVGHVALYLGDGYILHTASDHAVIEKISAKRRSYFICARRIR